MKHITALLALLLLSCGRSDQDPPELRISNAWARATAPGQNSAAAYLTIGNTGGADILIGVSSAIGEASLHSTSTEGGIMRMRPLETLAIPAEATVGLTPGGTHIMISGLKSSLNTGDSFGLALHFGRSGDRQVKVEVRDASAGDQM